VKAVKHDRLRTLILYKLTSAPNSERRTPNASPNHESRITNYELRITNFEGFTLLELIIVMFLATIILGLTTVFFSSSLSSARLDATGREMSATIRHARLLSQNRGEDQVFMINMDTGQYGLEGRNMKTIPDGISVRVNDPLSGEIRSGQYPILFRAYGGAEGGTVILQGRKKVIYIQTDPVVGSVMVRQ
jgi:type II secretory pathway pseudopilin PulG